MPVVEVEAEEDSGDETGYDKIKDAGPVGDPMKSNVANLMTTRMVLERSPGLFLQALEQMIGEEQHVPRSKCEAHLANWRLCTDNVLVKLEIRNDGEVSCRTRPVEVKDRFIAELSLRVPSNVAVDALVCGKNPELDTRAQRLLDRYKASWLTGGDSDVSMEIFTWT